MSLFKLWTRSVLQNILYRNNHSLAHVTFYSLRFISNTTVHKNLFRSVVLGNTIFYPHPQTFFPGLCAKMPYCMYNIKSTFYSQILALGCHTFKSILLKHIHFIAYYRTLSVVFFSKCVYHI